MTEIDIARVCHEANRVLCETQGDFTQVSWWEAQQWQRDSAVAGVRFAVTGSYTPQDQHEAWKLDKLAHGWTYGPEKDTVAKTHPCIVPYDELPRTQKLKDVLFQSIARALG